MKSMFRPFAVLAALGVLVPGIAGARSPDPWQGKYIVADAAGSGQNGGLRPTVPNVSFVDAGGGPFSLARLRGRVVLISFWTMNCRPCLRQLESLDRLQGDFRGEALVVLAVSEDRAGVAVAKPFLSRQKLTFLRPFADPGARAAAALGVVGIPTSFIVDKHGRLVTVVTGPYEWDSPQIAARFHQLVGEP